MTRNELWEMLINYAKENKKFPSVAEFSKHCKLSEETLAKVFKTWSLEDKLTKQGGKYCFVDNTIQKEIAPKKKKHKKNKSVPKKETNIIFNFIKILVGIIGTILIGCSVHFTFNFNKLGMHIFWAFMLSVSIVLFMGFAFTIKSYVEDKGTKIAIVILWTLGISYSVFTAVSGQYNEFRHYTSSDKTAQIESSTKIYKQQLKQLEKKQSELLHWREQETEYSLNPDLKIENPGTWKTIQNGVKQLNETESKIEIIQNNLLNNATTNTSQNETVYNWLASFLGVRADIIQFIIVLFPALFIDLCSTICLTFSLGKK